MRLGVVRNKVDERMRTQGAGTGNGHGQTNGYSDEIADKCHFQGLQNSLTHNGNTVQAGGKHLLNNIQGLCGQAEHIVFTQTTEPGAIQGGDKHGCQN